MSLLRITHIVLFLSIYFLLSHAGAASVHPGAAVVDFSFTHDVGFGNSLYVVGSSPELGSGDPAQGIKLRYTDGNVWVGSALVGPSSTPLDYRFVRRDTDPSAICDPGNATAVSSEFSVSLPEAPAPPYEGKTIEYMSGWPRAFVIFKPSDEDAFQTLEMPRIGEGRTADENRFSIRGLGTAGTSIEFVFTDGAGSYDNAFGTPGLNYETALDFLLVQDGHVFNYEPAAEISPERIETRNIASSVAGIAGRRVRIFLPRGYNEHTEHHYPVVYLHDGQNVFAPGGAFGSWDFDRTAAAEIRMGRVRECLIVAIDNTAERPSEYLPPSDSFQGPGRGDAYADFVIGDVRAEIDEHYRTIEDASDTVVMGSSFGGIISVYFAWAHSEVFGKAGLLSPSWWAIPQLRDELRGATKRSDRIFLYWGTEESSVSADAATWWPPFLEGYDIHLSQGYAPGADFLSVIGCGGGHNEAAWAAQVADALRFLLDIRDEGNALTYSIEEPQLAIHVSEGGGQIRLNYTALAGFDYQIEESSDLSHPEAWSELSVHRSGVLWEPVETVKTISASPGSSAFFRLQVKK